MMSRTDLMLIRAGRANGASREGFLMNVCLFLPSEEEMDTTPAPATKAKKAGMVKAKEESEEEEDDDEEEEDDDEEDDDEEEEGGFCDKILHL